MWFWARRLIMRRNPRIAWSKRSGLQSGSSPVLARSGLQSGSSAALVARLYLGPLKLEPPTHIYIYTSSGHYCRKPCNIIYVNIYIYIYIRRYLCVYIHICIICRLLGPVNWNRLAKHANPGQEASICKNLVCNLYNLQAVPRRLSILFCINITYRYMHRYI